MHKIIIIWLCLTASLFAQDFYCDADGDGGVGTSEDPFNWSEATDSGNVSPGDVIACRGDFGDFTLQTTNAKGTAGNYVKYTSWTTDPILGSVTFGPTEYDAYIEFEDWVFNPGALPAGKHAFNMEHVNYVIIDQCSFTGATVDFMSGGTYAPYAYQDDSIIWDGDTLGTDGADFIQITNCTFTYGYNQIRCTRNGNNWTISGNTMTEVNDNSIQMSSDLGSNSVIQGNTIGPMSSERGIVFWLGTEFGSWAGREGEAIIQDSTNATASFYEMSGGAIYMYPDGAGPIPRRNNDFTWRLVSNPSVVYFEVTGGAGNSDDVHSDGISLEGDVTTVLINRNYIFDQGITGQLLKLGPNGGYPDEITITNNIFIDEFAGTFLILFEGPADVYFYNNFSYVGDGHPARAVRFAAGTGADPYYRVHNNILSNCVWTDGTLVSSSHNIWEVSEGTLPATMQGKSNDTYSNDFTNSGSPRMFQDFTFTYASLDLAAYDASSPQIDTASATYAPVDDFLNNSRPSGVADDKGSHEFQSGGNPPKYILGT